MDGIDSIHSSNHAERRAIATSALSGCTGIAVLMRDRNDSTKMAAILAHFSYLDNLRKERLLADEVSAHIQSNMEVDQTIIMVPGRWRRSAIDGKWSVTAIAKIPQYTFTYSACGANQNTKIIPYNIEESLFPSESKGSLLVTFPGEYDSKPFRIYSEGNPVQFDDN
ncbi:hypothetical protein EOL96_05685 [Candidatus Saccharibacteria bacterium]|nr:hypothetical protein [Candidatus Saccharibacteria bacterium]